MHKRTVLIVDGHGFAGPVKSYYIGENQFNYILINHSLDVLSLFGVAVGFYVPFKIRCFERGLLMECSLPGKVLTFEEIDSTVEIAVEIKSYKWSKIEV